MSDEYTWLWVDRWISSLASEYPALVSRVDLDLSRRVSCIIDPLSHGWQLDFIEMKMVEVDKMVVLDTPIDVVGRKDILVWLTDRMGRYMVKSGYHWVYNFNRRSRSLRHSPSLVVDSMVWKCIWNIAIPPKIKNFLWKIL